MGGGTKRNRGGGKDGLGAGVAYMASGSQPSTRTYLKGAQTREQVLRAAKNLFTQRGYRSTSIYDVFAEAGITKGAFYHHWRTKEDLALTILDELKAAYETHVFSLLSSDGRARDVIEQALSKICQLNANPEWVYCRLMAMWSVELDGTDEALGRGIREVRERCLGFWESLLARAQAQGDLRRDIEPKELSFLMVGALMGVYLLGRSSNGEESRNALETIRRVMFA